MSPLQSLAESPVVQRLGLTLLHSLWQGLAVAICLAVLLPIVRRRGARTSYAVCCGALMLLVLMPASTFFLLPDSPPARSVSKVDAIPSIENPLAAKPTSTNSNRGSALVSDDALVSRGAERPQPAKIGTSATPDGLNPVRPNVDRSAREKPTAESPPTTLSWTLRITSLDRQIRQQVATLLPWAVCFWTLGVLVLSLWNVGGWFAVRRLESNGTGPVSTAIQQAAARIANQLGLTRSVRLLQSALVDSPLVIGALRPVILLPASLLTEMPADQLESLLAHELAHVLRQDYLVNLLQSAIETLLFYHPAAWWISAQVRAERENCCDDLAVGVAADRAVYVKALARIAGARPSTIVPAATGGRLAARLRRLLGVVDPASAHSANWLTGVAVLSLCGVIIASFAIGADPAAAQVAEPRPKDLKKLTSTDFPKVPVAAAASVRIPTKHSRFRSNGHLQVRVVDVIGQPLAGALIRATVNTGVNSSKTRGYSSDSDGRAVVELPTALDGLLLSASKAGYAEERKPFRTTPRVEESALPTEFQFQLVRLIDIGGVVKDDAGKAIEGARVETVDRDTFARTGTKTDTQGSWRLTNVPAVKDLQVRVTHPDYIGDPWFPGQMQREQKVSFADLREKTAVIVLHTGIAVSGRVSDPSGNGVKNAILRWGEDRDYRDPGKETRTREDGTFRFPVRTAGSLKMAVVAEGWMPELRTIEVVPQMPPTDFRLKPGKKLRLRIVDKAGASLPGVAVQLVRWRGSLLVSNIPNAVAMDLRIPRATDGNGIYQWDWAPDEWIDLDLSKTGFANRSAHVAARDGEQTITLDPLLHISGNVVDAATGRAVDDFIAVPILYLSPNVPHLDRERAQQCTTGHFDLEFARTGVSHGIQIEAWGYETYRATQRYRVGEANADLQIRLEPGKRYVGQVVDADGHPVPSAHVYVASASEQISHDDLEQLDRGMSSSHHRVGTDQKGAFEIVPQVGRYALIVVSPGGYAEVQREGSQQPGQIRTQRWAKVTGRLLQSGKPVPNCRVAIDPIRLPLPRVFTYRHAVTQNDGSFVMERVPPIPSHISGYLNFAIPSPLTSAESVPLRLVPGEAVDVTLGGDGIDVTGQFVVEKPGVRFDRFSLNFLIAKRPGIQPPDFLVGKGFDWKQGWNNAWENTAEGWAYRQTLSYWSVKPEPDGRFRISGVKPGEYDFAVNLYGEVNGGRRADPFAGRVVHVSVKKGQTHLDLGKILVPSHESPKVSQVDDLTRRLEIESPKGDKTTLVALRGNYVLLAFWSPLLNRRLAQVDDVERLRGEFVGNHPLVVVGTIVDTESFRTQRLLKSMTLPWHHALLRQPVSADEEQSFMVATVPKFVLIDPEGQIVAHEVWLKEIESKLSRLNKERNDALKK